MEIELHLFSLRPIKLAWLPTQTIPQQSSKGLLMSCQKKQRWQSAAPACPTSPQRDGNEQAQLPAPPHAAASSRCPVFVALAVAATGFRKGWVRWSPSAAAFQQNDSGVGQSKVTERWCYFSQGHTKATWNPYFSLSFKSIDCDSAKDTHKKICLQIA